MFNNSTASILSMSASNILSTPFNIRYPIEVIEAWFTEMDLSRLMAPFAWRNSRCWALLACLHSFLGGAHPKHEATSLLCRDNI
jgi:hypothetical protein